MLINATRNAGKRIGRAKTLGIPKPMKAIRLMCLYCVCHQEKRIRECPVTTCDLYPYRMGKYPKAMAGRTIEALSQSEEDGEVRW